MPRRGYRQSPEHIARRQGRVTASSPEDVLAELARLRAEGGPVKRRVFNLLDAAGRIELSDAEAAQIGMELIELVRDAQGHSASDWIPDAATHGFPDGIMPLERHRAKQRIASRHQRTTEGERQLTDLFNS